MVVLVHELWQLWRTEEFFNAAVTGRILMICCGVKTSLSWIDIRSRTLRSIMSQTNTIGWQNSPTARIRQLLRCRYRLLYRYLQQVEEVAHSAKISAVVKATNFIIWVGITNNCNYTIWIIWCNNLEFLNNQFQSPHNHLVCIQICSNHHPSILRLNQSHHVSFQYQLQQGFHLFPGSTKFSAIVCPKRRVLMLSFVDFVTTNSSQVITTWIKETSYKQAAWASAVLVHLDEDVQNFFKRFISTWICWVFWISFSMVLRTHYHQRYQQFRHHLRIKRRTSVVNGILRAVDTSVGDAFESVFKPCPTVRDNCWSITHFTVLSTLSLK